MGADGIKFQLFRAELLVVRAPPRTQGLRPDRADARRSGRRSCARPRPPGWPCSSRPSTCPRCELAAEEGVDAYKVHSTDMENPEFIRAVGAAGRPVLFATGGVPEDAVREALDLVGDAPVGPAARVPDLPHPDRGDPLPRAARRGRSATGCRSASSTTPTAAAPSPWWRPRWPWPRARTWSRSTSRSTAARRASTTSRRSTPRTSTAWSSCCARRSARRATAPPPESEGAQALPPHDGALHRGRRSSSRAARC